jgi:L-histidine Nalpha-methyltransferase
MTPRNEPRLQLITVDAERAESELAGAVLEGLAEQPKRLPCRFFYDAAGSRIFEQICNLPEYYLTRAEHEILQAHADEIAGAFPGHTTLVELGSGSAAKTRVLIEAFLRRHGALRYVPVDISRSMLEESAHALLAAYPALEIVAIAGEYRHGLKRLRAQQNEPKLILWLGSSIGNFADDAAVRLLAGVASEIASSDRLLVGADLKKAKRVLQAAYDDPGGVTARFNKNILARINRELDADFDLRAFRHEARWNREASCVEMHLVATTAQRVRIARIGLEARFDAGESIHTENSYKYTGRRIREIATKSGLRVERRWLDDGRRFALSMLAKGQR